MASPQLSNGYTEIAHEVLEALYAHDFTAKEFRIILLLIRRTWGWKKKIDSFSVKDVSDTLGFPKERVRETLTGLIHRNVVRQVKAPTFNTPASYMFEKNWEAWTVSKPGQVKRKDPPSPRKQLQGQKSPDVRPCFRGEDSPQNPGEGGSEKPDNHALPETPKTILKTKKETPNPKPQPMTVAGGRSPLGPPEGFEDAWNEEGIQELYTVILATLQTVVGQVTRANERALAELICRLATRFDLNVLHAGTREACREVLFAGANLLPGDKGFPRFPVGLVLKKIETHCVAAAAQQSANERIARKRAEDNLPPRKPERYAYVPPVGWKPPTRLVGDPALLDTPLARFVAARQAGLPEGGAGPGPDLSKIGRDLNELEGPHGT